MIVTCCCTWQLKNFLALSKCFWNFWVGGNCLVPPFWLWACLWLIFDFHALRIHFSDAFSFFKCCELWCWCLWLDESHLISFGPLWQNGASCLLESRDCPQMRLLYVLLSLRHHCIVTSAAWLISFLTCIATLNYTYVLYLPHIFICLFRLFIRCMQVANVRSR